MENDTPQKMPNVPPFVKFVCANVPMVFDDSLSYYEALCALWKYVQGMTDVINNNATLEEEYIEKFNELKEFVDNYFEDLDVQDEINNKLDQMVEDGTFDTIINQEIFGELNSRVSLLDNKKYIFLGDSYCEGYTPNGKVPSWAVLMKQRMGLTDDNCTITYHGGWGFAYPDKWFSLVLDELDADSSVTDIVVCGGYNDRQVNYAAILAGVKDFARVRDEKFPNARIHVGFIGKTNEPWSRYSFSTTIRNYIKATAQIENADYLNGVEYALSPCYTYMASDGYHPNQYGQELLADFILQALLSGSADVHFPWTSMNITRDVMWSSGTGLNSVGCSVANGTTFITDTFAGAITLHATEEFDWVGSGSWKNIGDITDGYVTGNQYNSVVIPVHVIIRWKNSGVAEYLHVPALIKFEEKKMKVALVSAEAGNYKTYTAVTDLQIFPFSGAFDSLMC